MRRVVPATPAVMAGTLMAGTARLAGSVKWWGMKVAWLLVDPSQKWKRFVSWDDEIPNIWKNKTCSKPPTSFSSLASWCQLPMVLVCWYRNSLAIAESSFAWFVASCAVIKRRGDQDFSWFFQTLRCSMERMKQGEFGMSWYVWALADPEDSPFFCGVQGQSMCLAGALMVRLDPAICGWSQWFLPPFYATDLSETIGKDRWVESLITRLQPKFARSSVTKLTCPMVGWLKGTIRSNYGF